MIHAILQIFIYIIIADVLLSWVPEVRAKEWAQTLHKIANAPQQPIRDLLPKDLPLDPAPMIVIIIIQILMHFL